MFWTNSRVVLSYIQNTKKRFKMFVANCIRQIKSNSDMSQWHYIQTNENPEDDCSRGLEMKRQSGLKRWFRSPDFCGNQCQHDRIRLNNMKLIDMIKK